jgi:hypothetical protein
VKRVLKLVVVGMALWLELLYFGVFYNPYPHGTIVDVPYRQKERHAAHWDYLLHPSPVSKVAWEQELMRMRGYIRLLGTLKLGFLITVNGIGIYYFVVYGQRKAAA